MASLLDLLAPWLSQAQQTPDQVVSAQSQTGANMAIDPSMVRGMPQQKSYDQQLQDPNQWNLSGQADVPDYSRITTPGNPAGPSYNANYGQTAYPGATVDGNPYGSLVPPAARGLLMASSSYTPHARWQHGTGRENDTARELAPVPVPSNTTSAPVNGSLAQMIQWLKKLQTQNPTSGEGLTNQQLQQLQQQLMLPTATPGAVKTPGETL